MQRGFLQWEAVRQIHVAVLCQRRTLSVQQSDETIGVQGHLGKLIPICLHKDVFGVLAQGVQIFQ